MLSFEQAPPISVPLRFFLTAPLFGIAAGVLLLWIGDDVFASRWTPGALALTHLLTAGFMLHFMCGALLQLVPVAAGGNVYKPMLVAGVVHPSLVLAVILLVAAFLGVGPNLFFVAAGLAIAALGPYVLAVGYALLTTQAQGPTVLALRIALPGLALTIGLGATLAIALARGSSLPLIAVANLHALWGLGGWSLALLAGVSYLLVPMFQLTPAYPARLAKAIPVVLFLACTVATGQLAQTSGLLATAGGVTGAIVASTFALISLRLQRKRRRKAVDATFHFFRGAMVSLLLAAASWLTFQLLPALGNHPRSSIWLGVLVIVGVFASAISGAVYKILPFLNWLHLQRDISTRGPAPNMKQMISDKAIKHQLRLHFLALLLLLGAAILPQLSRPAGLALAISFSALEWNLVCGVRSYLVVLRARRAARQEQRA